MATEQEKIMVLDCFTCYVTCLAVAGGGGLR